jgi:hypothetical protein
MFFLCLSETASVSTTTFPKEDLVRQPTLPYLQQRRWDSIGIDTRQEEQDYHYQQQGTLRVQGTPVMKRLLVFEDCVSYNTVANPSSHYGSSLSRHAWVVSSSAVLFA